MEHGFGDLNQALLSVMVYPYPDRVRPGELAERTNMTRQAMNYLLGQLEALGHIERRVEKGGTRRLVFLTRRGWQVVDAIRAAVKEVEDEWAAKSASMNSSMCLDNYRRLMPRPTATRLCCGAAGQQTWPKGSSRVKDPGQPRSMCLF
jgi:DNA-binding MarR family transcriptional regulator